MKTHDTDRFSRIIHVSPAAAAAGAYTIISLYNQTMTVCWTVCWVVFVCFQRRDKLCVATRVQNKLCSWEKAFLYSNSGPSIDP